MRTTTTRLQAAVLIYCLTAASCIQAQASSGLNAPFALTAPQGTASHESCSEPPPPVVSLSVTSKYGSNGPMRDTEDSAAEAESKEQMAPVYTFTSGVVKEANRYTRTGSVADAQCALSWLSAWAQGNALSQMNDHNAEFERGTTLAGLSLSLIQISPAISSDPRYAPVAAWMHSMALDTLKYFDNSGKLRGSQNNHAYWAALGVAGTSVATADNQLLEWSDGIYKNAVCSATPEGGLPLELARGQKALAYHLFALDALVPLAVILHNNNVESFEACNGALHRIVSFSLNSVSNSSAIAALAGKAQESFPGGLPNKAHAAFIEAYRRYFPGKAPLESQLLSLRPLTSTNLGGDQTLLYSR